MRCTAIIKAYEDPEKLAKCIEEEKGGRSSLKTRKERDHLAISIEADDEAAMRASLNSAMKGIAVFEKMRGLG